MPEMTMIERVARAIYHQMDDHVKRYGSGCVESIADLNDVSIEGRVDLLEIAKAAIEAMREPTEAMVEAGGEANYGWTRAESAERAKEAVFEEHASNAKVLYQGVVDAALKENEENVSR